MSKRGCVLNDAQLSDLMRTVKEASEESFYLDLHREDIVSALYELQRRRAEPDLPDADELLAIEEQDREAQEDALSDRF